MLALMLGLIEAYFGTNAVLTVIFFAIALLIRRRDLGNSGVSIMALRQDAFWFALFGAIGLIAATPLVVVYCVVMIWVGLCQAWETAWYFAKCESSV